MIKHRPEPNIFDFWIEFNSKLWNGLTNFYSVPQTMDILDSFCFRPISAWNQWFDQCLHFQVDSVLPSVEHALVQTAYPDESTAEAILRDIQVQQDFTLPHHHEFDSLIYPWHEAEPAVNSEIAKVA